MSPTFLSFHTHYWEFSDTSVTPIAVSVGGYPVWQASVITPSLLGILGAWIDTRWVQVKWYGSRLRQLMRLSPRGKQAIVAVLDALLWVPEPRLSYAIGADLNQPLKKSHRTTAQQKEDREAALTNIALALKHPAFGPACMAVRETAQTLGFNQPNAWIKLSHELKDHREIGRASCRERV